LASEKAVERLTMDAQDAADPDGVEPTVVDETPDRLGMDAELVRDFANADEARSPPAWGITFQGSQVLRPLDHRS
jgi:hypothetical protein